MASTLPESCLIVRRIVSAELLIGLLAVVTRMHSASTLPNSQTIENKRLKSAFSNKKKSIFVCNQHVKDRICRIGA
jgi:hypothetical protein